MLNCAGETLPVGLPVIFSLGQPLAVELVPQHIESIGHKKRHIQGHRELPVDFFVGADQCGIAAIHPVADPGLIAGALGNECDIDLLAPDSYIVVVLVASFRELGSISGCLCI